MDDCGWAWAYYRVCFVGGADSLRFSVVFALLVLSFGLVLLFVVLSGKTKRVVSSLVIGSSLVFTWYMD